jgi:methylenetetrahydrofolate--tRNA-(uracil-5-)-methyltransferase
LLTTHDSKVQPLTIIGGGLAGCEAAWQAARRGVPVVLYEMRPKVRTPIHETDLLAELVCSNSLRSDSLDRAQGLLKQEMRRLGSLIMAVADETRVPAGSALAVDRAAFAAEVTRRIRTCDGIEVLRQEVTDVPPEGTVIVASGPLTSPALAKALYAITGEHYLFFYDAVSPIVAGESIDMNECFPASRYDKGDADYLNCPLDEGQYDAFRDALVAAERAEPHEFEKHELFEGCLPVEVLAARGKDALRFGPMKPVGLTDPQTGQRPHAVVQLRPENRARTMYNLVGFQTSLRWGGQKRVFRMIPALRNAEFLRFGVVHRNTYINAPALLNERYQCRAMPRIFFAGQLSGVEGYVESAGSGLVAGINAVRHMGGGPPLTFPQETMLGALAHYIANADRRHFQPMNANLGLLPPIEKKRGQRKLHRKLAYGKRALKALEAVVSD